MILKLSKCVEDEFHNSSYSLCESGKERKNESDAENQNDIA